MNIDLVINGTLGLIIFKDNVEVTDIGEIQEVHKNLNDGVVFVNLRNRTIVDADNAERGEVVLYTFDFDVVDTTEYDFELNDY